MQWVDLQEYGFLNYCITKNISIISLLAKRSKVTVYMCACTHTCTLWYMCVAHTLVINPVLLSKYSIQRTTRQNQRLFKQSFLLAGDWTNNLGNKEKQKPYIIGWFLGGPLFWMHLDYGSITFIRNSRTFIVWNYKPVLQ